MSMYRSYKDREINRVSDWVYTNIRNMCTDAVKMAQENANQIPPSHPQVRTGTLRRSITMDIGQSGAEVVGKVGIMSDKSGGEALVYAAPIEFGSKDGKRPPYPYLYPAVEYVYQNHKSYFRPIR